MTVKVQRRGKGREKGIRFRVCEEVNLFIFWVGVGKLGTGNGVCSTHS